MKLPPGVNCGATIACQASALSARFHRKLRELAWYQNSQDHFQ
jgi:hypothetical protein